MLLVVLSGFVLALAAPWLTRAGRRWTGWLMALLPLAMIGYVLRFTGAISENASVVWIHPWIPGLGINLSFYLDGLSLLFVLLIAGVGALVLIYSGAYLDGHPQIGRFFAYILLFMSSMLGLVLAGNLIALFIFWELTSISSFLLIGFDHEREAARTAAVQALLVTAFGGLALLAASLMMGTICGTYEIPELLTRGEVLKAHPLYVPMLVLILLGAFTKSAQAPFHFWLPNAMEAPTPVSTYLHSATMVKAGIYLLARLYPVLGATPIWTDLITPVGVLTMVIGAYLSLVHTDMKRILAYSTVSALGMLMLMLGIEAELSSQAVVVFLLAHALYKGALFLVAGVVDHETGTRNVDRLSGLFRVMPIMAVGAFLAGLSSAGIPPLFGFIGKELIYKAAFAVPSRDGLIAAVLVTSVSFVAVAAIVAVRPYWGEKMQTPGKPHRSPPGLWLPPVVLAILGLAIGIFPGLIEGWLIVPAVAAIEQKKVEVHLALWHGLDLAVLFSIVAFVLGIALYFARNPFRRVASYVDTSRRWGPDRLYDLTTQAVLMLARIQTRLLQSGHLHFYMLIIIGTTLGVVGTSLLSQEFPIGLSRWTEAQSYELVLAALILAAAVAVVRARALITAVVCLGVVGYGVALVFMLFSAPDLAMTQFSIETLSVVVLVLVLFKLPGYEKYSTMPERIRDAIPALAAGGLMTLLVLMATGVERESRLAGYFAEHSLLDGRGRNVVNVILVDFRGFDTLGEITVLSVAALGVFSLLRLYSTKDKGGGKEP